MKIDYKKLNTNLKMYTNSIFHEILHDFLYFLDLLKNKNENIQKWEFQIFVDHYDFSVMRLNNVLMDITYNVGMTQNSRYYNHRKGETFNLSHILNDTYMHIDSIVDRKKHRRNT